MASLEDADLDEGPSTLERFVQLLKDEPLYGDMFFWGNEMSELLAYVQESAIAFDSYCPQCMGNTTWRIVPDPYIPGNMRGRRQLGEQARETLDVLKRVARHLDFKCARDMGHLARFSIDVGVRENLEKDGPAVRLTKFGQLPSLADIAASEIDNYRQFVTAIDLAELKRAVGLAAHGIGIGSFVYLRRIFERLVNEAADRAAAADKTFDRAAFVTLRMEDKLQAVKDYIPDWVVKNRKLYSILSLGLHELSEEACKAAFPAVRQAILALLEQHAEQKRREQRAAEATGALEKLSRMLSGGN